MTILQKALDYIVNIVTKNEEVQQFPKDFVTTSMQWIRTWFLIDDPKTEAKLQDPNRSQESKKTLIEMKLEDLQENPQFMQELEAKIASLEQQKKRVKNKVEDSHIEANGNVQIGDKGNVSTDTYDEKNTLKGSTLKASGDVQVGDAIQQGQTIINNNYYQATSANNAKPAASTIKTSLKQLLTKGKTTEVINRLLDLTEQEDGDVYNTVLLLSAQLNRLQTKEQQHIIDYSAANIERNRITVALMGMIDELEE